MSVTIKGMTERKLLKIAQRGTRAEIEDECRRVANSRASLNSIRTLRELIQRYDAIDAALGEIQREGVSHE